MAGNHNSGPKKEKPFLDALRLAIHRANNDRRRLDTVASMLVAKAEQGDVQAILAIADRLDGKPVQQTENYNVNEHSFAVVGPEVTDDKWKEMLEEIRSTDSTVVPGRSKHNGNGAKSGTH